MAPRHAILEHQPSQPQTDGQPLDAPDRPFQVGDVLPLRMTVQDMGRAFRIGRARVYKLADDGAFDAFEILPRIGARAWSGEKVTAYLKGQPVITRTFGRRKV